MLKKLSKSRKKIQSTNITNSKSKHLKQHHKDLKQSKQMKKPNKNSRHHNASTITLLSHHNHSVSQLSHVSQSSLYGQQSAQHGDKNISRKQKSKKRQSSVSSLCNQHRNKSPSKSQSQSKSKSKSKQKQKEKQKSKVHKENKKHKQKSKKHTATNTNQNSKSKKSVIKFSPQKPQKQKQKGQKIQKIPIPTKKTKAQRQDQLYQRINLGLYKSKTNSQINFSNSSSIRQNKNNLNFQSSIQTKQNNDGNLNDNSNLENNLNKRKKILTIDCTDQYIIDHYFSNSLIKNQQKRRVQAAIKIQKVFRGYLTRKMLQQYIQKQQKRLLQQLSRNNRKNLSESSIDYQNAQSKRLSQQSIVKQQKLIKQFKNQQDQSFYSNQKIKKLSKHKISNDMFLQNSEQKTTKGLKNDQQPWNQEQSLQQSGSYQISLLPNSKIDKKQHPINHQPLQQQSSIHIQPQQIDSLSQYIPEGSIDGQVTSKQTNKNYRERVVIQHQISVDQRQSDENQFIANIHISRELVVDVQGRDGSGKFSELYQHNQQYYVSEELKYRNFQKIKSRQYIKQNQKKSEQLFRPTPAISAHTSQRSQVYSKSRTISKMQQPIPTDFSEKKIGQFQYQASSKSKQFSHKFPSRFQVRQKQPKIVNQKQESKTEIQDITKQKADIMRNLPQSRKTEQQNNQRQKRLISNLKKEQKEKWSRIIQMLNHQIVETKAINQDHEKFMNMILQISKKNKQQLQKSLEINTSKTSKANYNDREGQNQSNQRLTQSNLMDSSLEDKKSDRHRNLQIQLKVQKGNLITKNFQSQKKNNFILFKKPPKNPQSSKLNDTFENPIQIDSKLRKKQQISSPELQYSQTLKEQSQQIKKQFSSSFKANKNSDLPLVRKKVSNLNLSMFNCHAPSSNVHPYQIYSQHRVEVTQNLSLFQKTQQLKNFYRKNLPTFPIQQMIQIREKALQKRQRQELTILNEQLVNNKMSHEKFIKRLSQMQNKFESERQLVNKAKMQIFLGYQATYKLMQDSMKDAWYLGFKIPFSHSLKEFKGMNANWVWVKELVVDELKSFYNKNLPKKPPKQPTPPTNPHNPQSQIPSPPLIKPPQKKHQLSLNLPSQSEGQNSGYTLRPNHELSQQSIFSQQISYNQGDIELDHLRQNSINSGSKFGDQVEDQGEFEGKKVGGDSQGRDSGGVEENLSGSYNEEELVGFRKVDPKNIIIRNIQSNRRGQKPKQRQRQRQRQRLNNNFFDTQEQLKLQQQISRKIMINPRRQINLQKFDQQQVQQYQNKFKKSKFVNKVPPVALKSQIYKIDLGNGSDQQQQELIFTQKTDPQIIQVTQNQIIQLIWQVTSQLYMNTHIRSKLCKLAKNKAPNKIQLDQRLSFINFLVQQIPAFSELESRINQKMSANRLELLKFMRVNFDEDEEELQDDSDGYGNADNDGFEEIGKFQHILSADVCMQAMNMCIQHQEKKENQMYLFDIDQQIMTANVAKALQNKVSQECIKKVVEREKIHKYNQIQKNDLRREIKKVEYHCIFDSLNELVMKKRLKICGYSGIGLNQLSLVMSAQSFKIIKQQQQFKPILNQSLKQLQDLVSNQKTSSEKLLMENYQKLCQNDSQWIFYTDQALSFALEFVYMLQDEIFFEQATVIASLNRKH